MIEQEAAFRNCIIKTYDTWYVALSNGEQIECSITKGWEYMIDTRWHHFVNGKTIDYYYVVYNLKNSCNKPYEKIDELRVEAEKIIKSEKKPFRQLSIFDFMEV